MIDYAGAVSSSWSPSTTATTHAGYAFARQEWSIPDHQRVVFEVHDYTSTPNFGGTGSMFNPTSHNAFLGDLDLHMKISEDAIAQLTLDINGGDPPPGVG